MKNYIGGILEKKRTDSMNHYRRLPVLLRTDGRKEFLQDSDFDASITADFEAHELQNTGGRRILGG